MNIISMNNKLLVGKAEKVLNDIIYLTIATVDWDGNPWNTPVYSAHSVDYTFYWVSDKENQHSQNIINNKKAFVIVYDSTVAEWTWFWVYIEWEPEMLDASQKEESEYAANILAWRKNVVPRDIWEYNWEYPRRIFKFTPKKVYVNVDGEKNWNYVDKRIDITKEFFENRIKY